LEGNNLKKKRKPMSQHIYSNSVLTPSQNFNKWQDVYN
jgi:hypothetical protein